MSTENTASAETAASPENIVTMSMSEPDAAPRPPAPPHSASRSAYGRLWREVPRELGYLLPLLPVTIVAFSVLLPLFVLGLGTIVLVIGLPIIVLSLYVGRWFGTFDVLRLGVTGFPRIQRPQPGPDGKRGVAALLATLANPHDWLALVHTVLVAPVLGLISWTITIVWTSVALAGCTFWIFGWFVPNDGSNALERLFDVLFPSNTLQISGPLGDMILAVLLGILLLITLPFVTRGLTAMHWGVARVMLGSFTNDELREQVSDLTQSRSAAVAAEGTALRRLERDIHDGPQQRLVRLQMDLAAAQRKLESDPKAAQALLDEARRQSRDALEELRSLSRGFAPPLLLDRGLVVALESLAARSAVPTRVEAYNPLNLAIPLELERNAYFIASEALTNTAKHAQATSALVRLTVTGGPGEHWLDVTVIDDGRGGAASVPGHGLAGLEERTHGLGGTLAVSSPVGGPTVVAAHLPIA